jgi:hypothetical protein
VLTAVPSPCHSGHNATGLPRSTTDTHGPLTCCRLLQVCGSTNGKDGVAAVIGRAWPAIRFLVEENGAETRYPRAAVPVGPWLATDREADPPEGDVTPPLARTDGGRIRSGRLKATTSPIVTRPRVSVATATQLARAARRHRPRRMVFGASWFALTSSPTGWFASERIPGPFAGLPMQDCPFWVGRFLPAVTGSVMAVSGSLRRTAQAESQAANRRQTPYNQSAAADTQRHTKRQGGRHHHSITAGQGTAVLVFTRQRSESQQWCPCQLSELLRRGRRSVFSRTSAACRSAAARKCV